MNIGCLWKAEIGIETGTVIANEVMIDVTIVAMIAGMIVIAVMTDETIVGTQIEEARFLPEVAAEIAKDS